MAGRGPAAKPSSGATARRKENGSVRVVRTNPGKQPTLDTAIGRKNPITGEVWLPATKRLWKQLGEHPTTKTLLPVQWSSLARAVAIDDAVLQGNTKLASEARLRLGKFFIDPDDVLRGRFVFVPEGEQPVDPDPEPTPEGDDDQPEVEGGIEQPVAGEDPRLSLVS